MITGAALLGRRGDLIHVNCTLSRMKACSFASGGQRKCAAAAMSDPTSAVEDRFILSLPGLEASHPFPGSISISSRSSMPSFTTSLFIGVIVHQKYARAAKAAATDNVAIASDATARIVT